MGFAIFLLLIVVLVFVVTVMVAKEQKEREEDAARRIVPGIPPPPPPPTRTRCLTPLLRADRPPEKRGCVTALSRRICADKARAFLALNVGEMSDAWDYLNRPQRPHYEIAPNTLLENVIMLPKEFWNLYKEERDWLLEKMQACGCRSSDLFDEEMLKLRWPDMPDDFEPPGYRSDWVKETQEKLSDYGPSRDEDKKAGV